MTSKIFELLSADTNDFGALLRVSGLDAGRDLKHCDFSDVDFGELHLDRLDLSHCNLTRADLSRSRVKHLITHGADLTGTKLPSDYTSRTGAGRLKLRQRIGLIKQISLEVHRFEVDSQIRSRIIAHLTPAAPLYTFFRSESEQTALESEITDALKSLPHPSKRFPGWMSNSVSRFFRNEYGEARIFNFRCSPFRLNSTIFPSSEETDNMFLSLFFKAKIVEQATITAQGVDVGASELVRNWLASGETHSDSRQHFLSFLRSQSSSSAINVFVMSGFPPCSQYLWERILGLNQDIALIFLMPYGVYRRFAARGTGRSRNRGAIHIAPHEDIEVNDFARFHAVLLRYKDLGFTVSPQTATQMRRYLGRPVSELKNYVLDRLFAVAKDREGGAEIRI
jgi:uncharacterized protein YjbI with pentapeptide repeats